jgi:hypothetical protein
VDDGTYVIGKREVTDNGYSDGGIIFEDGWKSVDKVLHPETNEFYSSKPPLLATLVAGLYWVLKLLTGWTLAAQPNEVVRTLLLVINGLPFAIYLWQLGRLVEEWGHSDWGRLFVFAAGAFGTLVTPFLITFNNHTVATFAVMFAWMSLLRIGRQSDEAPWWHFVSAGFFSAFAVTNELPALAFAAAVLALLLYFDFRRTLIFAMPPALVVATAFFVTNYAVLGTWKVAYANTDSVWYQYEGSHWKLAPGQKKTGIDWARKNPDNGETVPEYAMHVLVGHHGWFSLTPIWLLALVAMGTGACRLRFRVPLPDAKPQATCELPWFVHPLTLVLSSIVIGFYLYASDNYGGFTNGLRWLMWLTPIWLTCMLPIVDRLGASKPGRWFAGTLLAISVFSMSYQLWSPWRHPWIFDLMLELGWKGY